MKPLPHIHTPVWQGRAVLFDLDGVLVDGPPLHREALRQALWQCAGLELTPIEEANLEGLPTVVKMGKLQAWGRLESDPAAVIEAKQAITRQLMEERIRPESEKIALVHDLAREGYALGVVSNAIHPTVTRMLQLANLIWPMAVILSNEHVTRPKPAPDGWVIAMYELGAKPDDTLIIEDSLPGIASAHASGAHVLEVAGSHEVTRERVFAALGDLRRGSERREGLAAIRGAGRGLRLRAGTGHALAAAGD